MDPITIVAIINGVLSVAGALIPLIPSSGGSASIQKLLDMLTAIAPLITDQIGMTYTGIKNIISALGSHPGTTADQLATLMAFNKQVDDAWDAIAGQLDPDPTAPVA
jgi:hypothetical protein